MSLLFFLYFTIFFFVFLLCFCIFIILSTIYLTFYQILCYYISFDPCPMVVVFLWIYCVMQDDKCEMNVKKCDIEVN